MQTSLSLTQSFADRVIRAILCVFTYPADKGGRFVKITVVKPVAVALTLVLYLVISGCGSSGSGTPLVVSGQQPAVSVGPAVIFKSNDFVNNIVAQASSLQAANPAKALDWAKFITYFGDIIGHSAYDIELRRMQYTSVRADGSQVMLSGLVILPRSASGAPPAVPIIMYQHATEPYRVYAPSQFLLGHNPFDYPEVIFAAAMASTGYAVALPDYQGMGDNTDIQPFVHARALADQVVDMLRATRDTMNGKVAGVTPPCSWNNKLFLMGYSEGGFVTLAAARELQLNHAGEFNVTAVAPMAGPHDLSGTMRSTIIADSTFKNPYFIPFVLAGYYNIYKDQKLSPDYTMIAPYNTTLPQFLNGNATGETINLAMGMTYTPLKLIVPKSILTANFIADLQNPDSSVSGYLRAERHLARVGAKYAVKDVPQPERRPGSLCQLAGGFRRIQQRRGEKVGYPGPLDRHDLYFQQPAADHPCRRGGAQSSRCLVVVLQQLRPLTPKMVLRKE